jgi:hypothetical protein
MSRQGFKLNVETEHCRVLRLIDPKFRIVKLPKLIIYEVSLFNKVLIPT